MKILIACEESQAVCKAFRRIGFEAFSCDIIDCSGDMPQYHIKGDAIEVAYSQKWDCMIAFPPCTDLAVSGAMHFEQKRKDGRQKKAIDFFMELYNAPIKHIAIENPVGVINKMIKPSQIIQPYFFGDKAQKTTCLWLKNLPKLVHNDKVNLFGEPITHVEKGEFKYWTDKNGKTKRQPLWYYNALNTKETAKIRSKTFEGIANTMATQWLHNGENI